MFTVANIIVSALMLYLSGLLLLRHRQHSRVAVVVFCVRPSIRLVLVLSCLVFLGVAFPVSLYLIGYITSLIAVTFAIDVVVERTGIFFGLRLLRWERIAMISDHSTYLLIETRWKSERKAFLKFIWQIRSEDVGKLQSLLAAAHRRIEGQEQPTINAE